MFYENFEHLCHKNETSPSAVALKIGLSRSTPAAWKANKTVPKEDDLIKLANELNCTVADFFLDNKHLIVTYEEHCKTNTVFYEDKDEIIPDLTVQVPVKIEDIKGDILEFIKIYRHSNTRQKHKLMSVVYDFEDKVLSAEQED